jgi:hypothetical protein
LPNDLSTFQTETKINAILDAASGGFSQSGFSLLMSYFHSNELSTSFMKNGITFNAANSTMQLSSLLLSSVYVKQSITVSIIRNVLQNVVQGLFSQILVNESPLFLQSPSISLLASREFVRRPRNLTNVVNDTYDIGFCFSGSTEMASRVPLMSTTFIQSLFIFDFNVYSFFPGAT